MIFSQQVSSQQTSAVCRPVWAITTLIFQVQSSMADTHSLRTKVEYGFKHAFSTTGTIAMSCVASACARGRCNDSIPCWSCRQMFANQKLVSTAAAKEVAEAKELANAQKELGRAQAQVCPFCPLCREPYRSLYRQAVRMSARLAAKSGPMLPDKLACCTAGFTAAMGCARQGARLEGTTRLQAPTCHLIRALKTLYQCDQRPHEAQEAALRFAAERALPAWPCHPHVG